MAQYGGGHGGGDHQYDGGAFGYPTNFPGQSSATDNPPSNTNINDFSQQAILDQDDSHIMSSFFDNPDVNFDFNTMEHKPDSSPSFDFASAHQFAHASGATPSHTSQHQNYRTNSDGQLFQHGNFAGQFLINNHNQLATPAHDEAVYNTASTLVGLSNSQTQDPASTLGLTSTNWLNFGIPNSNMPASDSHSPMNSSGRRSAVPAFNTHMQTHGQSIQSQQNAQYLQARLSQIPSPQYHPGVPRVRHSFNAVDTSGAQSFNQQMTQSGRPQSFYQGRPQSIVRFGSDDSFSPMGYRGTVLAGDQEKELNLTNVPLADQVAGSFQQHLQRTMSNPSTLRQSNVTSSFRAVPSPSTSPANIPHGLPFANPVSSAQQQRQPWSRTQNANAGKESEEMADEQQARKRRKSGIPRDDDDAEYLPETRTQGNTSKRGSKVPKAEEDDLDTVVSPNRGGKASAKRKSTISRSTTTPTSPPEGSESPSAGPSSLSKKARNEAKARQNLTEDQKRNNHIQSEQKRRNVIKQGYSDLNELVPSLNRGKSGLSKAEVLKEVVCFLENTVAGNDSMEEALNRSQLGGNNFRDGTGGQGFSLGDDYH